LHLNLISATTNVIYYNPSTDPYDAASIGAGGTWNGQLQSTLTSVIGEANYDIGHLFELQVVVEMQDVLVVFVPMVQKAAVLLLLLMVFHREIILTSIMWCMK
jgi:hypothetical protein